MINKGISQHQSSIHRLVQKVISINLERDPDHFRDIAIKIEIMFTHYSVTEETQFHYLHFLLNLADYNELKFVLSYQPSFKKLFLKLKHQDITQLVYFYDLAQARFVKQKYLEFLGEALLCYMKFNSPLFLNESLKYIEDQLKKGILSKEEIQYILDYRDNIGNPSYKETRLSSVPETRRLQLLVVKILFNFKEKIFGDHKLNECLSADRKKRSTACWLKKEESETSKKQIRYQHLRNIGRVAEFVSFGLFSKDFLVALLKGDLDTVAIDFSLLASGYLLGTVSNKLLTMGETLLSDEKVILEENLKLENTLTRSILFSDEVLTAGKRRFIGKTMKLISPLVAKGTTIYIAYNFAKELNAYESDDKQVLPNLILDGTIISVEGAEAVVEGAEFLGLISGISAFTGPIGEDVIALLWLGTEAYYAKEQVDAIKKHVHLSGTEKFVQGLRAFFQLSPSAYLETKANNNQLVENAIRFLTEHTDIKRYVFSAWRSATALHGVNNVFLDKKVDLTLSDTMPDDPNEGNLICLSGTLTKQLTGMDVLESLTHMDKLESYISFTNQRTKTSIYLCEEAIGVEYFVNRTGDLTLVSLDQGDDKARVISDFPSIFFVNNGKKDYQADNSLFILQGDAISGHLQGGKGINSVTLNNFHPQNEYLLLDSFGVLCGKNVSHANPDYCDFRGSIKLNVINQIYGRKKIET